MPMTTRAEPTALLIAALRRVPWRNVTPILALPVLLAALTGPARATETIRITRLLALCCGVAAASSFDDAAGSLTFSTPLPHLQRQGAVFVHIAGVCAVAFFLATSLATWRGHELPLMDLAVGTAVATVAGCALGVAVSIHRPGDVSAWWSVSAFVMATVSVAVLWRPLASMDPSSVQWARAQLGLRRALIPAAAVLALTLVWPDLRKHPVRAQVP